jgi:RNA polymerase sigma factor (sigma-70 family)
MDTRLVEAAKSGDKAAFGELIEQYEAMVYRALYRSVGDGEIAHDLMQETFLQAYLSLDALRHPAYFKSWLYGIAVNVARSHLRSRRNALSLDTMMGGIVPDFEPSPEEIAEQMELRRTVFNAVERLSPLNRAAVMLFYYEDFSLREAAEILNISQAAMKGRLHKARQQLKQHLFIYEAKGKAKMIPVKLVDVRREESKRDDGSTAVFMQLILFDEVGRKALVIWIGEAEGLGIAQALNGSPFPRPMTQLFMARLLKATGATVEAVEISALKDSVFYATLRVRSDSGVKEVDARPSDALGLAAPLNVPLFVSVAVMAQAGIDIPAGQAPTGKGLAAISAYLEGLQQEYEEQRTRVLAAEEQSDFQALTEQVIAATFGT